MNITKTNASGMYLLITGLIGVGILFRLVDHLPNFTPITAIALFSGAMINRKIALLALFITMVLSDAIIGFHSLIFITWGAFLLIAIGSSKFLRHRVVAKNVILASLISSSFYFLVTNLAVWFEGRLYERTLSGLAECFVMAIPFFRNALVGDLIFTLGFFGTYFLARNHLTNLSKKALSVRHIN